MNKKELKKIKSSLDCDYSRLVEPNLDEEQKYYINCYSKHEFEDVNRYLLLQSLKSLMDLEKMVQILETGIKLYSLPFSLDVFRGTSYNWFNKSNNLNQNWGTSKTFMSTTLKKEVAKNFAWFNSLYRNDQLLLKIHIPKGVNVLWMKPLSYHSIEDEILLPVGTNFEIVDETKKVKSLVIVK